MKRVDLKLRARESLTDRIASARLVVLIFLLFRLCAVLLTAFFVFIISLLPKADVEELYSIPIVVFYAYFSLCIVTVLCSAAVCGYLFHRWFYVGNSVEGAKSYFRIMPIRFQLKIIYLHFLRFSKRFGNLIFFLLPFALSTAILINKLENKGVDSRLFGLFCAMCIFFLAIGLRYLLGANQKASYCDEILCDCPHSSAHEVLKAAEGLSDRQCFALARLKLSFFGWYLLCVLLVPLFFVIPYYSETVALYRKTDLESQGL